MAVKTTSQENSVVKEAIVDLPIVSKFEDLMTAATGSNSIYILAKNNLDALTTTSDMTAVEKANVLADFYKAMIPSITNACLNAATQIVIEDRDGPYKLTKMYRDTVKLEEEKDLLAAQNEKINSDIDNVDQDKQLKIYQGWKMQSDMAVDNGYDPYTWSHSDVKVGQSLSQLNSGLKYNQGLQIKGNTYSTYAKSFRESGIVNYELDNDNRISKVTPVTFDGTEGTGDAVGSLHHDEWLGLTNAQTAVAIRQKQGFDDNMLQHVANSSASFMGLLLSGEEKSKATTTYESFDVNTPIGQWYQAVNSMYTKACNVYTV